MTKKRDKAMQVSGEKLDAALAKVCDEKSFIDFLKVLSDDWFDDEAKSASLKVAPYGPSPNGWENGTIGNFLEASAACGTDGLNEADGHQSVAEAWHRAARIILGGKHYE
jgi:hypothetical protein